ncbi:MULTISPECIES: hypothetical protein [unclassified Clostridium]|uniref:hypothetical protein n=1 Tax=unclassified Clostridium TaxID=2614128 RepID=UPI0025C11415|nr:MULTISPECIES: hypothetical protein [unclassified Clostridium]
MHIRNNFISYWNNWRKKGQILYILKHIIIYASIFILAFGIINNIKRKYILNKNSLIFTILIGSFCGVVYGINSWKKYNKIYLNIFK